MSATRVTIIGAGVTGLAIASGLRRHLGSAATVDIVEAADHAGGMISGVELAGITVDPAADAIAATPESLSARLLKLAINLPVVRPRGAPQQLVPRDRDVVLGSVGGGMREVVGISGGMWRLAAELISGAGPIRCGELVAHLRPVGRKWVTSLADGAEIVADAVVVAVPPGAARQILRAVCSYSRPGLAPRQSVLLAYEHDQVPKDRSSGFLRSATLHDSTPVTGLTWIDVKWPAAVTRPNLAIARAVLDRRHNAWSAAQLVSMASTLVADLWGIQAPPVDARAISWREALPVGPQHAAGDPRQPMAGLILAGSAYGVTGIAACLDDAATVVQHLVSAPEVDARGAPVGAGRTGARPRC
ncbi:MAG TPA: FAD-dependent oxidoreductase [Candidatus Saccharimonadales bacterium]|nr:FAD-dependent oxidoreductase [Candidatus Saccharimonadales bacterium]